MTVLYLVRHAEAQGNLERIFHGWTDGFVTKTGEKQLEYLAKRFGDIDFDIIYASDLTRTQKTARAIKGNKDVEIITDENLREINGGDWEGRYWKDVLNIYPKESNEWNTSPYVLQMPNGESMTAFEKRVKETILKIVKENADKTIVIATHGTVIRVFENYIVNKDIKLLNNIEWSENCSVTKVIFDDNFEAVIDFWHDNSHIPKDLTREINR